MAIFTDAVTDDLKKKLETNGYEALTSSELLIVVSAHFNHDVTSLKKAAWGSMYGVWAVGASIIANIIVK